MANTTICERCGGENPHDARFCIDCGATLGHASTGPTTQLRGAICPHCHAYNPEGAQFCASCGRSFAPAPRPTAPRPTAPPRQSYPRMATPPHLQPYRPAPIFRPSAPRRNPAPIVFLVGLVLLMANGALWPGILVLMGVTMLVRQVARGRPDRAVGILIWIVALAFLVNSSMLWPGIFVLLFLSGIFGRWGGHW